MPEPVATKTRCESGNHTFLDLLIRTFGLPWRWCRECKNIDKPCVICEATKVNEHGKPCTFCKGTGYVWVGHGEKTK